MPGKKHKTCFVIAPIGEPNSDIRKYSDRVLRYIIKMKLDPLGYKVTRADEISEPGTINEQIIRELIKSDVVIADLTGTNPNVMYELAIRHIMKKPVILMIAKGEKPPFDIYSERTIFFDITDIADVEQAKQNLGEQVKATESKKFVMKTHFSNIDGIVIPPARHETLDERLLVLTDDVRYIKGILKTNLESLVKESPPEIPTKTPADGIKVDKWIKIRIEYPTKKRGTNWTTLEISNEESIFSVLTSIWSFLNSQKDSKIKPKAFTYLWDWLLVRNKRDKPLIVKGILNNAPANTVFHNGELWRVVELTEPLLNKPERYGIKREHTD